MKQSPRITALLTLVSLCFVACGGNQQQPAQNLNPASLLPETFADGAISRSGEVRTFAGPALYEHINGGAEFYHTYGFVDVATAYYLQDEVEILVDVFHFDTPEHAYGLYSSLRPAEATAVSQGVEGFSTSSSVDFVKGDCLVRLTGYDESTATSQMLKTVATAIEAITPGTTAKPETFAMFPTANRLAMTDRIWSVAFLGQQSLTDVYTQRYVVDGDSLMFFLTVDPDGAKLAAWTRTDGAIADPEDAAGLPFDSGESVIVEDYYSGNVLGGAKGDLLLGIVNYSDKHHQLLADWINGLR